MRPLNLHFPHDAMPILETFWKQTQEARVFRRAQAVRDVVNGHRPRPGRPPTGTCALAPHLDPLVDHDPLQHGSSQAQGSCQARATVLAHPTGGPLSRASVREV
jgi:hypothetical protein